MHSQTQVSQQLEVADMSMDMEVEESPRAVNALLQTRHAEIGKTGEL